VLLGYFAILSSVDALGSAECSRQTFSPVDCPHSSSEQGKSNYYNEDEGNIEEQIPSVIPFP
jgi:hypothetical protein